MNDLGLVFGHTVVVPGFPTGPGYAFVEIAEAIWLAAAERQPSVFESI